MKTTKSLLAFIPVLALAGAMLLGAGVASAGTPPTTPNGYAGAQNMINPHNLVGMNNSMNILYGGPGNNGLLGMCNAVLLTTGKNPC